MDPDLKILIVDDEMLFLISMKGLLAEIGYKNIFIASDGEAALAFCKKETVDIVLLDVIMPGTSGWDVAVELRDLNYPAAIIFTSADDTAEFGMMVAKVGGDDFIPKAKIHQQFEIRADRALRIRASSKGNVRLSLLKNSIENLRIICQQQRCGKEAMKSIEILSDIANGGLADYGAEIKNEAKDALDFISNTLANTSGNIISAAVIGAIQAIIFV